MSNVKTEVEVRQRIAVNEKYAEPKKYNVVYLNDDVTTFEFVVETLTNFFGYPTETAEVITAQIHQDDSAVVATLPYELAEQKGIEVTLFARQNGFPLQVKVEVAK